MPARALRANAFFDTNVLIYAVAEGDPRAARAEALLAAGGILSVQVLNEFAAAARRKLRMPWNNVKEALDAFRILCPSPIAITIDIHEAALQIAEQHEFGIHDALIVASALKAGCAVLYSEDFQGGQVLDGRLTIRNPFV